MKALNLHAVGDLRYEDVPMPVRQAGEVLLKVHACGICGSDLPRVFTKGTYHFPTIPGHEFAGEIVEADDRRFVRPSCRSLPAAAVPQMRSLPGGRIRTVQRLRLLRLAARRRFRRIHRREGVEPGLLRRLTLLRGGRDVRTGRRSASRHRSGVGRHRRHRRRVRCRPDRHHAGPVGPNRRRVPRHPGATSIRPKSNSRANRDSTP